MSEGAYTNLDLDTAEQLLIAAGQPGQAAAMRQMTQGWRNMWQGEFGQSFVDAFDRVVAKHIEPLVEGQKETHSGIAALSAQFRELAEDVTQLKRDMRGSQEDRKAIRTKLAALEKKLDAYIAGSKRAEVEDLRREIDALKRARGDAAE